MTKPAAPSTFLLRWRLAVVLATDPALSRAAVACGMQLLDAHNEAEGCSWPSYDTLAEGAGIHPRTAKAAVAQLVEAGYFARLPGGGRGRSNRYRPVLQRVAATSPIRDETVPAAAPIAAETVATTSVNGGADVQETVASAPPEPAYENQPRNKGKGSRLRFAALPDSWARWAREQGHPNPAAAWERFSDYWRAQPGQKGRKADWLATWRNWIRRDLEQRPGPPSPRAATGGWQGAITDVFDGLERAGGGGPAGRWG